MISNLRHIAKQEEEKIQFQVLSIFQQIFPLQKKTQKNPDTTHFVCVIMQAGDKPEIL